jgi:hypothetical protein
MAKEETRPMTEMDKVLCENPDPEKQGTRIDRWEYEVVRRAILDAVPSGWDGFEYWPPSQ